jgi:hypothetical protein
VNAGQPPPVPPIDATPGDPDPLRPPDPRVLRVLADLEATQGGVGMPLSEMYRAACAALSTLRLPDRHALAAHALRELIEKVAGYVGVDFTPSKDVKTALRDVVDAFKEAKRASESPTAEEPSWQALVQLLSETAKWLDASPSRKDRLNETIQNLDISREALPEEMGRLRLRRLVSLDGHFIGIAHHKHTVAETEMWNFLSEFEALLLALRRPEAVSDRVAILSVIRAGEAEDDSRTGE